MFSEVFNNFCHGGLCSGAGTDGGQGSRSFEGEFLLGSGSFLTFSFVGGGDVCLGTLVFGVLSELPPGGGVPRLPGVGGGRGVDTCRPVARCPLARGCSGVGGGGELLLGEHEELGGLGWLEGRGGGELLLGEHVELGDLDWPGGRGCSVELSDCGD